MFRVLKHNRACTKEIKKFITGEKKFKTLELFISWYTWAESDKECNWHVGNNLVFKLLSRLVSEFDIFNMKRERLDKCGFLVSIYDIYHSDSDAVITDEPSYNSYIVTRSDGKQVSVTYNANKGIFVV